MIEHSDFHNLGFLPPLDIEIVSAVLIKVSIDYENHQAIATVRFEASDSNIYDLDYTLDISMVSGSYLTALSSIRNRVRDDLKNIPDFIDITL